MESTSHRTGIADAVKKKIEAVVCKSTVKERVPRTGEKVLSEARKNKPLLCINHIHNLRVVAFAGFFLLFLALLPAASAVPEIFNVQGRLTNDANVVVTGSYDFKFYIYDALTGGNLLWSETHNNQAVSNGLFNTIIGDTNTAKTFNQIDFNTTKWLAIEVEGETQSPRIKMASIGTAMRTQIANDLNSTGDANTVNIGISGNAFIGNLFAESVTHTGDSNFTNIGISGILFGDNSGKLIIGTDVNTGVYDFNSRGVIQGLKFKSADANSAFGTNAVALGKGTTASGIYSMATGRDTTASGIYSMAMGYDTTASGRYSTAMGNDTTASGRYSTAMGHHSTASGEVSIAMGSSAIASNDYSTAIGYGAIASGYGSMAIGGSTIASNNYSTAMGNATRASGQYSIAMGRYSKAAGRGSLAVGYGGAGPNSSQFALGRGARALGYSDKNMIAGNEEADKGSIALGYNARALGIASIALGKDVNALGQASITLGEGLTNYKANSVLVADLNVADGNITLTGNYQPLQIYHVDTNWVIEFEEADTDNMGVIFSLGAEELLRLGTAAGSNAGVAIGINTTASGVISTAMGRYTTASGSYSTAMGRDTTASGDYSTAMGYNTTTSGYASTAMGTYSRAAGQRAIAGGYGWANKGPFAIGDGAIALGYSDGNFVAGNERAHYGAIALGYNAIAKEKAAIAIGYNAGSFAQAAVTLGQDLNNYNANSVLVQDLNVLGDANFMDDVTINGTLYGGSALNIGSDVNISIGSNHGVSIASDANRMCFPSDSCEMYIDYNGTAFVFGSG